MHKIQTVPVMAVLALLGAQGKTLAAPSGAEVVAGDAIVANHQTISGVNIDTLITQSSQRAVIDWASFDIGQDELVRFVQNGVDSVALNRITSGDATQILGQLQANGRLFLVNPSGIVFGSSAQVDVAGLVATTLDIDNTDFMKGEFAFEQTAVNDAEVRNEGTITIGDNGFAYLVAPNVDNSGTIVANLGRVGLATDGTYILDLQGNELIKFSVSPEVLEGSTLSVTNSGSGSLAGKTVVLAASGTETVLSSVVNDGDIQAATSFDMTGDRLTQAGHVEAGDIRLDAEAAIRQSGDMLATGQVDVDAGTDIMMTDGTTTRANGDIRYNADGSLQVANLTSQDGYIGLVADNDVTQTGDIVTTGTSVEVMAGTTAAGGPGSTGDIVMAEGTRTQAVDDIRYTAGRDLTVETLVSQPDDNVELRAGRTIYQNATITAAGQVDVDAGADIVMAGGTTTRTNGDIRYNADGNLQVANLTSRDGYIGLVADNDVTQTGDIVTTGTSVEVVAGTTAAGGPGSIGDIAMAEGTRTQAADDIRYTAGRDLTIEALISQPDDDIVLTAGRNLYQRAEVQAAGRVDAVAGNDLTMAGEAVTYAGKGIRYVAGQDLSVGSLVSSSSEQVDLMAGGDLYQAADIVAAGPIEASAGGNLVMARGAQTLTGDRIAYRAGEALHVAELRSEDVSLFAGAGALTAERGVDSNVTASRLEIEAAQGIGSAEAPLVTRIENLYATGGNGEMYIDNRSASLTVTGLTARGGDLALRTAGDLTTTGNVTNAGGGNLYLAVAGNLQQQADIHVREQGNVVVSGRNVTMADTASTTAEQGNVTYRGEESLAVSHIATSSRLAGGRIVLDAPVLTSQDSSSGQVQGAFVRVASASDDEGNLLYLLGDPSEATRIVVNQRTAGGQLTEANSRFVDSLRTSTGQVTSQIDASGTVPVSPEVLDIHFSTAGPASGLAGE